MTTVESMKAARRDGRTGHWVVEVRQLARWRWELELQLVDGPRDPYIPASSAMTKRSAIAKAKRMLAAEQRQSERQAKRAQPPDLTIE